MLKILQRSHRVNAEGEQERVLGHLNEMAAQEQRACNGSPSAIHYAFEAWKSDQTADVPYLVARNANQYSKLVYSVVVVGDDPTNFIFQNHAGLSASHNQFLNLTGQRVSDSPLAMNRRSVCEEYHLAVTEQVPLYHEITQTFNGVTRSYRRLLVVRTDPAGKPHSLTIAVRPIELSAAT